jgi:N-acetylglucosaminyldiphosphoundecaprenol N-acetyl-beta-D-mannosaminyltransferase
MPDDEINVADQMFVLGVPITITNLKDTVARLLSWAKLSNSKTVFVRDVASLMLTIENPSLLEIHHKASMVLPDGMPLVWIGKSRGYGDRIGRACGPDVLDAVCAASFNTELKHYFYGGQHGVAETMA